MSPGDFNLFYLIILQIKPYLHFLIAIQVAICGSAVILNWLVVDTARQFRHPTSGTIWMKYIAIWDILAVAQGLVLGISHLFGVNLENFNDTLCKSFAYFGPAAIVIANAHLVAMSVDRAFNMTYPTVHYPLPWKNINRKISLVLSLFYLCFIFPTFFISKLEEGVCKEVPKNSHLLIKLYQVFLATVGSFFTHFAIICVTTAIFIYQMRERRTLKLKLPVSALKYPRQQTLAHASVAENGEVKVNVGVCAPVENDGPDSSRTARQASGVSGTNTDCNECQCSAISCSRVQRGSQIFEVRADIEEHDYHMPANGSIKAAASIATEHEPQSQSDQAFVTESVDKMTMQESNEHQDCQSSSDQTIAVNVDSAGSQQEKKCPQHYLMADFETGFSSVFDFLTGEESLELKDFRYTESATYSKLDHRDIADFTEQNKYSMSTDTDPEASGESSEAVPNNSESDPENVLNGSVREFKCSDDDHCNTRLGFSSREDKVEVKSFLINFSMKFEEEKTDFCKNGKAYFIVRETTCDTEDQLEVTHYTASGQVEAAVHTDSTTNVVDCSQKKVVLLDGSNENEDAEGGQDTDKKGKEDENLEDSDCSGKSTETCTKILETEVPEMKKLT